jgi:hypothetical protein
MQYLVTMEFIDPGVLLPPQQLGQLMETTLFPTMQIFKKLQAEGKIVASGIPIGERNFVFVLEVESHAEADEIVHDLPVWGVTKSTVKPLQSLEQRFALDQRMFEAFKAMFGG